MKKINKLYKNKNNNFILRDLINKSMIEFLPKNKKDIKLCLNVGFKTAVLNKKILSLILGGLLLITGNMPSATKAHNPIANFKIKKNMALGCKITIYNKQRDEFIYKFKTIIAPNLSELKKGNFDQYGNFSFGLDDFTFYPEIHENYENFEMNSGMNLNFVNYLKTIREGKLLLTASELPIIEKS
jgi:large subunit ribosomal protein L5